MQKTAKHPPTQLQGASRDQTIFKSILLLFLTANAIAAWYAPILDCDEVFNYWEPTHFLNHGFGLQTWEYSPEYAIRSWLYIVLHAIVGQTARFKLHFSGWHAHEFLVIRLALAALCAVCQTSLFKAIYRSIEPRVAFLMALIMLTSTGMFYASVAYLPSSFSMYTAMLGTAAFIEQDSKPRTTEGILWFGIGAIVGWPFSAALILPLMIEELARLYTSRGTASSVKRIGLGLMGLLPVIVSTEADVEICVDSASFLILSPITSSFTDLHFRHGESFLTTSSAVLRKDPIFSGQSPGIFTCEICCSISVFGLSSHFLLLPLYLQEYASGCP